MGKHNKLISIALPLGLLFALGMLSFAVFAGESPLFAGSAINYSWKYAFFAAAGIGAAAIISLPCFKFILEKRVMWGLIIIIAAVVVNIVAFILLMTFYYESSLLRMLMRNSDREVFTLLALLSGLLLIGGGLSKDRKSSFPTLCATGLLCVLVMTAISRPGFCMIAIVLISCAVFMHAKTFAGRRAAKIFACAAVPALSAYVYLSVNLRYFSIAYASFSENGGYFLRAPNESIISAARLFGASESLGEIAIDNPAGILLASAGWAGFIAAAALSLYLIVRMFITARKGESIAEKLIILYFAINLTGKLIAFFFSLPVNICCRFPFVEFGPAMAVDYLLMGYFIVHRRKKDGGQ